MRHYRIIGVMGVLVCVAAQGADQMATGQWRIENRVLRARVDPADGDFDVLDKRNGYTWRAASAAVPRTPQIAIRRAAKAPAIDADLADWPKATVIRLTSRMTADAKKVDGPEDCSAVVRSLWHAAGFFVAIEVRDDNVLTPSPDASRWWERDCVELWLGSNQFGLRAGPGGSSTWARRPVKGTQVAFAKRPDGYVVEARLPMSQIGKPAVGTSFRFAVGVNDADSPKGREAQLYFPTTWKHSQTSTFALAILADEQGHAPKPKAPSASLRNGKGVSGNPLALRFETNTRGSSRRPAIVTMTLAPDAPELRIEVDMPNRDTKMGTFTVLAPLVLDAPGDILAARYCNGIAVPNDLLKWNGKRWSTYGSLDMPWVGLTDGEKGYLLLWETPDDGVVRLEAVSTSSGRRLAPAAYHQPSMRTFRYPRRVLYSFVTSGGHTAICKRYRRCAREHGFLKTLKEKARRRPDVKLLAGAPDVWGASGLSFCKRTKAAGIDRMIVNGSWSAPDTEAIKALGYLASTYDNYEDIVEGRKGRYGDCKIPDHAPLRADGKRQLGWLTFDKKTQFYKRCSAFAVPVARRWIPPDQEKHPRNARFLDVTTATGLVECYDPNHRHTRSGDRENKRKLAAYVGNELGLVLGGEHGRWWGADLFDYWEGMQSGGFYSWPAGHVGKALPEKREDIGESYLEWGIGHKRRVPLWELVFGDCVISTWYWGDSTGHHYSIAPDLTDKKDAFNILYGTIPLYWVNRSFSLRWRDPALRERLLQSYRNTCKLHEVIAFEEMVSHEYVTPDREVQRTRFADGTVVTANFGAESYSLSDSGRTYALPQYGFFARGPKALQCKAVVEGRTVTLVRTPGYMFCDAGGKSYDFGVCKTHGRLTARVQDARRLSLVIGGNETQTVLRPETLVPGWDLGSTWQLHLDEQGQPTSAHRARSKSGGIVLPANPERIALVCGPAARKPDFRVGTGDVRLDPPRPRRGQKTVAHVRVSNDGGVAGAVNVMAYVRSSGEPAAQTRVHVPSLTSRDVRMPIDTSALDGAQSLRVRLAPDGEELVSENNSTAAPFLVVADYGRWPYGFDLVVSANGVDRADPVAGTSVDLGRGSGLPAGQRPNLKSVRVVEGGKGGQLTRPVQSQFERSPAYDGVRNRTGTLVFQIPGRMAAKESRTFRVVFDREGQGRYQDIRGGWVTGDAPAVITPRYVVTLEEGAIVEWRSLFPDAPEASIFSRLGVSSAKTGWVKEVGEAPSVEVLSDGPVRARIRVRKKLQADYEYEKVYTFYPSHFVVEVKANKGGLHYSRAYYGLPCEFVDDKGNRARIDGAGDAENVSGKNRGPRWYAAYADSWAHSCVALSPFDHLTYWDAGAWGGVGLGTGRTSGVRMAYVLHPGMRDAKFAEQDYKDLTIPLVVRRR